MRTATAAADLVGPDHLSQFREEGWFALERGLTPGELALLRDECDRGFEERARAASATEGPRGSAHDTLFFFQVPPERHAAMRAFWHGDTMAAITRAVLGDDVYLFYEQFVVKRAERGAPFAWHQDSGYVGHPHTPYLTMWIALDDVSEANGTVRILPHSRSPVRGGEIAEHRQDEATWHRVGYHGDDPGIPVILPAGGIAVFSSLTFHCSGSNPTAKPRRAYVPQYSPEPIMDEARTRLWNRADPVIRGGKRVPVG